MDGIKNIVVDFINQGIIIDSKALKLIKDTCMSKEDIMKLDTSKKIISYEQVCFFIENNKKNKTPEQATETLKTEQYTSVMDAIKETTATESEQSADEGTGQLKTIQSAKDYCSAVEYIKKYNFEGRDRDIYSFVSYFNARYESFKKLLLKRPELKNTVSLNRFTKSSQERDVCVIGIVREIINSKKKNTLFEIEDKTGTLMVFVKEGKNIGEDRVLLDEVLGFCGSVSKGCLFAEKIIWPDIPLPSAIPRIDDPLSAVFISDLHFGSDKFLDSVEQKFINWINSKDRDAARTKYIFIAGDVVDGVGVYPSQEADLRIKDVYRQYEAFEAFVEKIPEHIDILVCPGNHDAVRSAEPQPPFTPKHLPLISSFKNVHLLSNPSHTKIHGIDGSRGINVLMYHGYSFTSLVDALPHLRAKGLTQPQHVMKDVIKRRHLAPLYGATIAAPEEEDALVIENVPDIFVTGDLHSHAVDNYKGVSLISASTFQGQTSFMDRVGHIANPGKVTVVELDTRKHKVFDFWDGKNA